MHLTAYLRSRGMSLNRIVMGIHLTSFFLVCLSSAMLYLCHDLTQFQAALVSNYASVFGLAAFLSGMYLMIRRRRRTERIWLAFSTIAGLLLGLSMSVAFSA